MTIHLYVSPAATGKTAFVLNRARSVAHHLQALPHVIVPTHVQVRAWRHRLAEAGGAMGVRVMTFDQLYTLLLNDAGETYTPLSDPVQYRLLRAILANLTLEHYQPIQDRAGFVRALQDLIGELKSAGIWPDALQDAVAKMGGEVRLQELAAIYAAYQKRLQERNWADPAGIAWLTVESLKRFPGVAADWPLLVVDGFDNFTEMQIATLELLSGRVGETLITLTGTTDGPSRPLVHGRFDKTRRRLQDRLRVAAEPLPLMYREHMPLLTHLEAHLYAGRAPCLEAATRVDLIEASDRQAETREALRWLKQRIVLDGMRPGEVALLARNLNPYRPFVLQIAAEFGLPVQFVQGLPLRSNPAIVALLDLLRLMLPRAEDHCPALTVRGVVQAWRSPYFDWSGRLPSETGEPVGIDAGDAERLDTVARWARVLGGQSQWEEALTALARRNPDAPDDELKLPANLPSGAAAQALLAKFNRFVTRLTPPADVTTAHGFVAWLEGLIGGEEREQQDAVVDTVPEGAADTAPVVAQDAGPDAAIQAVPPTAKAKPPSLKMVAHIRPAAPQGTDEDGAAQELAVLDFAALQALKDVLRGLVWAEQVVTDDKPVTFATFLADLTGAVDSAVYQPPYAVDRQAILIADVIQARGVALRAVAVLGLAEGEFPAVLGEDPFLRDADRQVLRERFHLAIDPSTESAETEFFYEAMTRPRERLLLTRPRLADNGATWQASPFWEETRRLVQVEPVTLTSDSIPAADRAASWPELIKALSDAPSDPALANWAEATNPARLAAWRAANQVLSERLGTPGPHDGDLSAHASGFEQQYGVAYVWSASRLEDYRTCPHLFFVKEILHLEPRVEPTEGLDARQLGNIFHAILKSLYTSPAVQDKTSLAQLLGALEAVANPILDAAPAREGFRATAWWQETRSEILENVRQSLTKLAEISEGWVPCALEVEFGGRTALTISDGSDRLRMRGRIDRIDRNAEGELRIIDYKTGGPSTFTAGAIRDGKRLQLLYYAMGAQEALKLGSPAEAFYWHLRQAKPSPFTLAKFEGGNAAAFRIAVETAFNSVRGIRGGQFAPVPPDEGCPQYCPGSPFCWHYTTRA